MIQYKYGVRISDGKVIDISEVPDEKKARDKSWNCVCPHCRSPLIAAKGHARAHHFKHKGTVCNVAHAHQTALHMRAKEILLEEKLFHLPAYVVDRQDVDLADIPEWLQSKLPKQFVYQKARWLRCNAVGLEKRISDIVPDVVAYTPEGEYLIEICVTNPVSDEKIEKAAKIGLPLLEVDLSDLKDDVISEDTLRKAVVDGCDRTEWRYYPDYNKAIEAARNYYQEHYRVKEYRHRQEQERLRREEERRRQAENANKVQLEQKIAPRPMLEKPADPPANPNLTDTLRAQILLYDISPEELAQVNKKIYAEGLQEVKDKDFSGPALIRDRHNYRWLRCWACGEIRRDDEMVMYQYGRGLCRECRYDRGVEPGWK